MRRAIRLPQATAIVAGIIIGASIFVQPAEITGRVPTAAGIFLVWAVAGLLTFFGALVCAELASTFQESGGVYVYLKESFSPSLGFLWGWAMFWSMHSGIVAAVAVIVARYATTFVPAGPAGTKAIGVAAVLLLSGVNALGVRQGSRLQTFFTAGKVLAIAGLVAAGFLLGGRTGAPAAVSTPLAAASLRDFLLAVGAGLFAFGGWHMVTYSSEETVEPRRTIPRALLLGVLVVTACYMALNAVYLHVLPLRTAMTSTRIAADAADALFGRGGVAIMSALVVFSAFGALNGLILAGPRVYQAMARDGLLFRWLRDVHPRFQTPHRALALQAAWSSVLVVTGTYRALFSRVVYTEWIFFGLMAVGLFLLRRRPGLAREFSIWGYPAVPAVFAAAAFAVAGNQIVSDPRDSLAGLGLVILGLPVYHLTIGRRNRRRRADGRDRRP